MLPLPPSSLELDFDVLVKHPGEPNSLSWTPLQIQEHVDCYPHGHLDELKVGIIVIPLADDGSNFAKTKATYVWILGSTTNAPHTFAFPHLPTCSTIADYDAMSFDSVCHFCDATVLGNDVLAAGL